MSRTSAPSAAVSAPYPWALTPEQRKALIGQPFVLLSPKVERRFASTKLVLADLQAQIAGDDKSAASAPAGAIAR